MRSALNRKKTKIAASVASRARSGRRRARPQRHRSSRVVAGVTESRQEGRSHRRVPRPGVQNVPLRLRRVRRRSNARPLKCQVTRRSDASRRSPNRGSIPASADRRRPRSSQAPFRRRGRSRRSLNRWNHATIRGALSTVRRRGRWRRSLNRRHRAMIRGARSTVRRRANSPDAVPTVTVRDAMDRLSAIPSARYGRRSSPAKGPSASARCVPGATLGAMGRSVSMT